MNISPGQNVCTRWCTCSPKNKIREMCVFTVRECSGVLPEVRALKLQETLLTRHLVAPQLTLMHLQLLGTFSIQAEDSPHQVPASLFSACIGSPPATVTFKQEDVGVIDKCRSGTILRCFLYSFSEGPQQHWVPAVPSSNLFVDPCFVTFLPSLRSALCGALPDIPPACRSLSQGRVFFGGEEPKLRHRPKYKPTLLFQN